jgi:xylulose-5-phosphate/fructose-6-phosphate phosphoketolase
MTGTDPHENAPPGTAMTIAPSRSDPVAAGDDPLARYRRAANYLSAAQIYLQDNVLLAEPLRPTHIKERLLGHWGTCPGINLVYAHLNRLARERDANVLLITGPGHGAAANLANLYLEGTLGEFYPEYGHGRDGLERFVRAFSWPGGFPSHLSPPVPGTIHEGGELGYALSTAFGAALDNPDLLVACIVGDGEAETGPTATAWHGAKFLDPATSGAVLPILHLNEFKISSPTIFATMTDAELDDLFTGYGYAPILVDVEAAGEPDVIMAEAVDQAYEAIRLIQREARAGAVERWQWPIILLRSPKGWTGPAEIDGVPVEGTYRSHQVPAKDARTNPAHLAVLETWLRSYRPEELFDADGQPEPDILASCPEGDRRLGMNPHTRGWERRRPLGLPPLREHVCVVARPGSTIASALEQAGAFLADVLRHSESERNFRIVCPDETSSNLLGAVFSATDRAYAWPVDEEWARDSHLSPGGRVMEILSEHSCQGWLQGYLQTGRHGLFPCYEAFVTIVDSMANQYGKWLKMSAETPWREPVPSLTYLLTSDTWRQDHNGFSHQGPGFINSLLTKKGSIVRIYLPPDANTLVSTLNHCLASTGYINLVIATKQPLPQWLTMEEAIAHNDAGASIWAWAGQGDAEQPDVVLAGAGNVPTIEVLAAAKLLREELPELAVRVVNVVDLLVLDSVAGHPHRMDDEEFARLFTADRPVIFNFHGYPSAIHQLIYKRSHPQRFHVRGYVEEGTTTTPFDMLVRNQTSRYHIVMEALRRVSGFSSRAAPIIERYERKLREHRRYIEQEGVDPPEIRDWTW